MDGNVPMTVKITGGFEKRINELKKLNGTMIYVGIPASDRQMTMIALVNDQGKTITPKKGEFLTVPAIPEMVGKRAKDIPGLFRPKGKNVLAVKNGNGIKVLFVLLKRVIIPARPFLRTTKAKYSSDWDDLLSSNVQDILNGKKTADEAIKAIGTEAVKNMQKVIEQFTRPSNSMLTINLKGFNNPLIMTGKMMKSVIYVVDRQGGE